MGKQPSRKRKCSGAGTQAQENEPPKSNPDALSRKKVDERIRILIENGAAKNHRSFFVVVGDHAKDQVVNLHQILSKLRLKRPSVLWCYSKELVGFSSNKQKRMRMLKKQIAQGLRSADQEDPFEMFVASTEIRYAYYRDTDRILGNTYGMCVLQDFESITPNLLARTVETVEGGGIVILLLKGVNSLKQVYSMTMDVHKRFKTATHQDVVNRFNERFLLSLKDCKACLVVDDSLSILPMTISRRIEPVARPKDSTDETEHIGKGSNAGLVMRRLAKTEDQAAAIKTFEEVLVSKTLQTTVSLTAARGRGKSAALGLSIANAIDLGYANIFVTAPSPENLVTLFQWMLKGLEMIGYREALDYDVFYAAETKNDDKKRNSEGLRPLKCVVRVNVFKNHRQTVQYIRPQDAFVLSHAELLVVDEAAAIPLPILRDLLRIPGKLKNCMTVVKNESVATSKALYLVFLSSTIHGYEGTGRSLSLKLLKSLREQTTHRVLKEINLSKPIRYSEGDLVEMWLNKLLCLELNNSRLTKIPPPERCDLYFISRDTLFSYHPTSETFLQRIMGLYVAGHYKNSPNDLQLMADAPAHQLFVLLPPLDTEEEKNSLPHPLCLVQICMEGGIGRKMLSEAGASRKRPDGDLIPWVMNQQYQDELFPSLNGARIVRIATHPEYTKLGYGSRALELLCQYFEGNVISEHFDAPITASGTEHTPSESRQDLHSEMLEVRDAGQMPPLLQELSERRPENLHWVGVSYGVTPDLQRFWSRKQFSPVYLRQSPNDLTGEHTMIMLRSQQPWLADFGRDFRKRFSNLLCREFAKFPSSVALGILNAIKWREDAGEEVLNPGGEGGESKAPELLVTLEQMFTAYDLRRLASYAAQMLDYHVIVDLLPSLSRLMFVPPSTAFAAGVQKRVTLSGLQAAILLGCGLQNKSVTDLSTEFQVPSSQILAAFVKIMRRFSDFFLEIRAAGPKRTE